MKTWRKDHIVGSPDEADLIIELAYRVEHGEHRVWSSTNSYDGTTQVHSAQIVDPKLVLTIYEAKSKNSLWSAVDHRRLGKEGEESGERNNRLSGTIGSGAQNEDQHST